MVGPLEKKSVFVVFAWFLLGPVDHPLRELLQDLVAFDGFEKNFVIEVVKDGKRFVCAVRGERAKPDGGSVGMNDGVFFAVCDADRDGKRRGEFVSGDFHGANNFGGESGSESACEYERVVEVGVYDLGIGTYLFGRQFGER